RARVVGNVLGAEGVKGRRDGYSGAEGKQEPGARFREARCVHSFTVADALRRQARLGLKRGGRSSVGRAPGCGPGGRGFESRRSPLRNPLSVPDRTLRARLRGRWRQPCPLATSEHEKEWARVAASAPADSKRVTRDPPIPTGRRLPGPQHGPC